MIDLDDNAELVEMDYLFHRSWLLSLYLRKVIDLNNLTSLSGLLVPNKYILPNDRVEADELLPILFAGAKTRKDCYDIANRVWIAGIHYTKEEQLEAVKITIDKKTKNR